MRVLIELGAGLPIVFPVHPRTRGRIDALGLKTSDADIRLIDPVGYVEFLALQANAMFVITDSGGVQEETTYLKVPCLTVRNNTERPITVSGGTNMLVGDDPKTLLLEARRILAGRRKPGAAPELWDGHAAHRIVDVILVGKSAAAARGVPNGAI